MSVQGVFNSIYKSDDAEVLDWWFLIRHWADLIQIAAGQSVKFTSQDDMLSLAVSTT